MSQDSSGTAFGSSHAPPISSAPCSTTTSAPGHAPCLKSPRKISTSTPVEKNNSGNSAHGSSSHKPIFKSPSIPYSIPGTSSKQKTSKKFSKKPSKKTVPKSSPVSSNTRLGSQAKFLLTALGENAIFSVKENNHIFRKTESLRKLKGVQNSHSPPSALNISATSSSAQCSDAQTPVGSSLFGKDGSINKAIRKLLQSSQKSVLSLDSSFILEHDSQENSTKINSAHSLNHHSSQEFIPESQDANFNETSIHQISTPENFSNLFTKDKSHNFEIPSPNEHHNCPEFAPEVFSNSLSKTKIPDAECASVQPGTSKETISNVNFNPSIPPALSAKNTFIEGSNLKTKLPLTEFPLCPVADCNESFTHNKLSKCIGYLLNHLSRAHSLNYLVKTWWCVYCRNSFDESPKYHKCFKSSSYFTADFSKVSFENSCNKCGFSGPSKYNLATHKCFHTNKQQKLRSLYKSKQHLKAKKKGSREKSPPTTINFIQGCEPLLSSTEPITITPVVIPTNHAIPATVQGAAASATGILASELVPPVSSGNEVLDSALPCLINASMPGPSIDTQDLLNIVENQLQIPYSSQDIFDDHHDSHDSSSDESEAGINGNIASPPPINSQPDQNFPGTFCMVNSTVHAVFPINKYIMCTVPGCASLVIQTSWSKSIHGLLKHLENSHGIPRPEVVRWCGHCKICIPVKITSHACFANGSHFNINYSDYNFKYKCGVCPFTCLNIKQMRNHKGGHVRSTASAGSLSLRERILNSVADPSQDDSQIRTQNTSTSAPPSPSPPSPTENSPGDEGIVSLSAQSSQNSVPTPEDSTELIDNPDSISPSAAFTKRFKDILNSQPAPDWDQFITTLDEYIKAGQKIVELPEPKEYSKRRTQDPKNPKFIQRLYRRNRRRAIRLITGEIQKSCSLDPEEMATHFFPDISPIPDLSVYEHAIRAEEPLEISRFSPEEVWAKLSKAENTAPGPDRLTYHHWKKIDPEGKTLAAIFNICLRCEKVPDSWKVSKTIFIPKNNDGSNLSDWRPISLCSTILKLFTGCLAKRLTAWTIENKTLSSAQKGFMPFDGAYENNYVVQNVLQKSRTSVDSQLCMASIDIKNAFGSAPHSAIIEAFNRAGAGSKFVNIVSSVLKNCFSVIATEAGLSSPRHIKCGVRQGDPLSGFLFNYAINPLITAIQALCEGVSVLAFADDIILIADCPELLQKFLDILFEVCTKIGFSINASKSFSIHIAPKPRRCVPTDFLIGGALIPHMSDGDERKFLGKPIGFHLVNDHSQIHEFYKKGEDILTSYLSPWQRLNAMKAFFYPSLSFAQRTAQIPKEDWTELDNILRKDIKKTLGLPDSASNDYLYGSPDDTLLGIPVSAEDADIALVDGAFKLLTSKDSSVRKLAWEELTWMAASRTSDEVGVSHLSDFLSNKPLEGSSNVISNIWTRARIASGRLNVEWEINDDLSCCLLHAGISINDRSKVFHSLRNNLRKARSNALLARKHQGKTLHCFKKDKVSCHYVNSGDYIRFTDWRFIHRARLGLVSLNAYNWDNPNSREDCRRCGYPVETLPHVLSRCNEHMNKIRDRHNYIVERVKNAAAGRWSVYKENQRVCRSTLRPDLILTKGNSALVLDVQVTFESSPDSFDKVRSHKITKYSGIVKDLRKRFTDVRADAIVVGSLGSWDPKNDKTLLRLCTKKYLKLMKKLIVSDTMRLSRDIFMEHITGHPQKQPKRYRLKEFKNSNLPISIGDSSQQPSSHPTSAAPSAEVSNRNPTAQQTIESGETVASAQLHFPEVANSNTASEHINFELNFELAEHPVGVPSNMNELPFGEQSTDSSFIGEDSYAYGRAAHDGPEFAGSAFYKLTSSYVSVDSSTHKNISASNLENPQEELLPEMDHTVNINNVVNLSQHANEELSSEILPESSDSRIANVGTCL